MGMTEQEAIQHIDLMCCDCSYWYDGKCHEDGKCCESMQMAIKALEEIEQYRAIGTVKEIKIKRAEFARLSEGYLNDLILLREYQSLGTVDELKTLKEKVEQKKSCPMWGGNFNRYG